MHKLVRWFLLLTVTTLFFGQIGISQGRAFITFHAKSGVPGHAFVSFVREDGIPKKTALDGVWGMYPISSFNGGKSFFVGEVPGEIRNDFLTRRDVGLTVKITPQEYAKALEIKNRWSNKNYELTESDCLSFVMEVATSLAHKLSLPDRSLLKNFPYNYVNELRNLNTIPSPPLNSKFCPHRDIVYDIPTDIGIQFNDGDFYWIELDNFTINGTKYDYGRFADINGDKRVYKQFDAGIVLLEGGGNIIPLQKPYGRFQGTSGLYRIIFNVDLTHPSVNINGSLTLVNKATHLSRNKYNKVAKGTLTRQNGNIFLDENGCEWELQNQCFNAFHQPEKNAKFLHKLPGGGEYETIREILPNEGRIATFLCPDINITKTVIVVESDVLKGKNVLSGPFQSSYNFGHTGLSTFFKHQHLDMSPHESDVWGGDYAPTSPNAFKDGCKTDILSTLFLFDLSGSMGSNGGGSIPKIDQAKNASRQTLASMRNNGQGIQNEVAIYGFQGGCREDPTTEIFRFSTDLTAAETSVAGMFPGGGTPLGKAIRAAECKLAAHVFSIGQKQGKLILLSDGQGTCGEIRPSGVYHNAPLSVDKYEISDKQCGSSMGQPVAVKYYTVGFDIPPGSPAERDLQYLSKLSGGKYLNVQNQTQLVRAFRKFNRVYRPKEQPALSGLPSSSVDDFQAGVSDIKAEDFKEALTINETFIAQHPKDCHGVYNLALSQEANDFYKDAIDNYRLYLSLCPDPTDKAFVEKQITFLEEEFKDFLLFQKEVVRSDLDFLKLHFERIQNGQSVALAMEFRGFLQEKGSYYKDLPRLIAKEDRFFVNITKDISEALDRCAGMIRRKPETWDRDAIPIISMTYLNLKDLLDEF